MVDQGGEHFVILGWGERSENDEGECFSQSFVQTKKNIISFKGSSPVLKEALVSKCSEQEEIPFKKILEKVGNVSFFSRVEREVSKEKKYPAIDSIREHEVFFRKNTIFQFVVHMQYWTPSFKTAPQRRPTCVTKWALESGVG